MVVITAEIAVLRNAGMAEYSIKLMSEIFALLDRIEIEENSTLSSQRFDIMEKYGYKVEFNFSVSASIN